jgi:hypothetical protein
MVSGCQTLAKLIELIAVQSVNLLYLRSHPDLAKYLAAPMDVVEKPFDLAQALASTNHTEDGIWTPSLVWYALKRLDSSE